MYQGPGRYVHHTGLKVRVHGVMRVKATGERYVIYESLEITGSSIGDDDFWGLTLEEFNELVGEQPRFERDSGLPCPLCGRDLGMSERTGEIFCAFGHLFTAAELAERLIPDTPPIP